VFLDEVARLGSELVKSDWALSIDPPHDSEGVEWSKLNDLQRVVRAYRLGRDFQRLDPGRQRLIAVADGVATPPELKACGVEGYRQWDDATSDWNLVPLNGAGEIV
jgi:hypothetical protein